jgi:DNA invertase Pin-like site-specific DNA recombinase
MLVGYARVSTDEQGLALLLDALQAASCETIFTDTMSSAKAERPGLTDALEFCRPGDVLAVWRLDRLGRSLTQLIALMTTLDEKGIGFKNLTEQIVTTTSGGKLIFRIFWAARQVRTQPYTRASLALTEAPYPLSSVAAKLPRANRRGLP